MNKKSIISLLVSLLAIIACGHEDYWEESENVSPYVIIDQKPDSINSTTNQITNDSTIPPQNTNLTKILEGKTIAILGDSYSTYGGWIPSGYSCWYGLNGVDGKNKKANNVSSVKQTWWWKLCYECGATLLINSSYSGSPICNTGYSNKNATNYSFITRMKTDIGGESGNPIFPDIIFIFGGTNDSQANVAVGELKYEGWTNSDLKKVLPAICYMFDYLRKHSPNSRIINISNYELREEIITGFKEACEYYVIDNITLSQFTKQGNHPNVDGMESIKNDIVDYLKKNY